MNDEHGWSTDPSSWSRRLSVLGLSLGGCSVATYLGLYQLGVIPSVWEPFFGNGSRVILKESSIAHLLPIPDALLGAGAYLTEAGLDIVGGRERWRRAPWIPVLQGLLAGALGLTGITLVLCQPLLFKAWCTLCLVSAGCSILIASLVADEALASWRYLREPD